ncbi:MAG: HD domain-containing phosphohydrolase, partial [Bryobacteraceae bacterium]
MTVIGLCALGFSLASWNSQRPDLFCIYFYLVLLTTGLRFCRSVSIGAMPIHVLFVLFGLGTFSLPETLVLACTSSLLDRAEGGNRTTGVMRMLFHVAVAALAMSAAYAVYHSALIGKIQLDSSLTMVLAASMFFIVRAPLLAGATSLDGGMRFAKIWQETHLQAYPYYVVGPAVAGMFLVPGLGFRWEGMVTVLPMLYLLRRSYSLQLTRLQTEKDHAEQVARLHLQIVEALAVAAEAKDEVTHNHLQRVQIYAMDLAEELHLGKIETESLRAASLLHDIGKLAVPDHILGKPGKLTPEEFERVKTHSIVGAEILRHVDFPYPVAPLVRAHHERWNGKGYPDGLRGAQIPLAARILAVADCLDALTSDRQYRRALTPEQAIQWLEIAKESGFDPLVVDALKRRYPYMLKKVQQLGEAGNQKISQVVSPNIAVPGAGYQQFGKARAATASGASEKSAPPICAVEQDILASLELGKDLRDSLSMEESLSVLAERLRSKVPYDSMALYVRENGRLVPRYVRGENRRLFEALNINEGQGLSGWVADNNTPIVNGNPATEPFTPSTSEWPNPLRSALAVPLEASDGMLGVLSLYQQQEDGFTEEHLRILQGVSPNISAMLQGMLRD